VPWVEVDALYNYIISESTGSEKQHWSDKIVPYITLRTKIY